MAFSILYLLLWLISFYTHNTLSIFAKTIDNLISILESECEIAINWFKENHMIANAGKFQVIIFDKQKRNHTKQIIKNYQKEIKAVSKVKLLGI